MSNFSAIIDYLEINREQLQTISSEIIIYHIYNVILIRCRELNKPILLFKLLNVSPPIFIDRQFHTGTTINIYNIMTYLFENDPNCQEINPGNLAVKYLFLFKTEPLFECIILKAYGSFSYQIIYEYINYLYIRHVNLNETSIYIDEVRRQWDYQIIKTYFNTRFSSEDFTPYTSVFDKIYNMILAIYPNSIYRTRLSVFCIEESGYRPFYEQLNALLACENKEMLIQISSAPNFVLKDITKDLYKIFYYYYLQILHFFLIKCFTYDADENIIAPTFLQEQFDVKNGYIYKLNTLSDKPYPNEYDYILHLYLYQ
jgi:hypothetical protein